MRDKTALPVPRSRPGSRSAAVRNTVPKDAKHYYPVSFCQEDAGQKVSQPSVDPCGHERQRSHVTEQESQWTSEKLFLSGEDCPYVPRMNDGTDARLHGIGTTLTLNGADSQVPERSDPMGRFYGHEMTGKELPHTGRRGSNERTKGQRIREGAGLLRTEKNTDQGIT
ncbi:hypothetical protein XENOCAPTIV_012047 [Xenoophorus captivus]|uniref:Prolactin receptor n=1 Tax=Xenoophorus captivus TaxID=1517983 RepID=A0ABV0QRD4_9TELE